ncbi:MAG: hypothetical protein JNL52_10135 [Flavobacteriales bacterium]|nr:hypothetical protein [Flavobacteriales bacterium]
MKQRIDHSNYEAWLLDRLEGNLSPAQEKELDAFLAANPGLDPGMDELPTLGQLDAKLTAADKNALKRTLPPTGMPSLENVDDFLVARLEGDLNAEQLHALRHFLLQHPDLLRSAHLYDLVKLVPETMAFVAKQHLERQLPPVGKPDRHTLDDFLVAELEGDLTTEQRNALAAYVATHPEAGHARELMQRTRIAAEAVVYAEKGSLKRGGRVIALGTWAVRFAAAASVALLLGMGIWYLGRSEAPEQQLATVPEASTNTSTENPKEVPVEAASSTPESAANSGNPGSAVPDVEQRTGTPAPTTAPMPRLGREEPVQLAAVRGTVPGLGSEVRPAPRTVAVENATWLPADEPVAMASGTSATPVASTLGGALASVVRERVLEQPAGNTGPLGQDDAIAAVDRGLKVLGGEQAGLSVDRTERTRTFNIRLGRNLTVTASTQR